MTEVGYGSLAIIPSFKGFQSKLEQGSAGAFASAGKSGGQHMASGAASSMASHAKKIVAPLLGVFAAVKVKDFLGDSIAEARDSQKVGALTTQVIKSTGKAAHITAKQVGDLSTAISNKVGIDDEAIQSGANMLLTFKNVRNEAGKGNKIFNQATQTITDMSSALGQDMKSSAIQLGKALNDPIKGVTALQRVGVTFDDQQKKHIKTLVAHNDLLGAQKIILGELNSEFGGAAAAQATWGEKASVAWSNFKEGIGTALLPVIDTIEKQFVRKGIPLLNQFSAWFQKDGVKSIEHFERKAIPFVKGVLTDTRDVLHDIAPYAKDIADAFNSLPSGLKKGLGAAAVLGFGAKKLGVGSLLGSRGGGGLSTGSGLLGLVSKSKPVPVFVVNDGGIGGSGLPGKSKGGGKIPGTPLPLATIPYLAPLLTKGDHAPGQDTAGMSKKHIASYRGMQSAVAGLYSSLGLDKSGFSKSGQGADQVLANLVKGDPGKAFKIIKQAADTAGVSVSNFATDAMPKTQSAIKHAEREFGGLDKAAAGVKAGANRLTRELFGTATQLDRSGLSAKQYKTKLDLLPSRVRTLVETPGAVTSRADVQSLKKQFDLTPRQVQTLVQLMGAGKAIAEASTLRSIYAGLPTQLTTSIITNHVDKFTHLTGARAAGGPVHKGGAYLVGEHRPEVFVPSTNGRIEPRVNAGSGGGGGTQRFVLDIGSGVTLTGFIQDALDSSSAFARTTGGRR